MEGVMGSIDKSEKYDSSDTNHVGDDKKAEVSNMQLTRDDSSDNFVNDILIVAETLSRRFKKTTNGVKQALYRSSPASRVFHAISNNDIVQFRIGLDGKLIFDKTMEGFNEQKKKLESAQKAILKAGKAMPLRAQKGMRKAITGDPNKAISDHMKEVPQVKMMDKLSFTIGVACIAFTQYIILRIPEYFVLYYLALVCSLFGIRWYLYKQNKYHLFMLDFCYLVNSSCMIHTTLWPSNRFWFLANYTMTLGPLSVAIVLWNNSLVFHSVDKLTSFFIHIFPSMLYHLWRWGIVTIGEDLKTSVIQNLSDSPPSISELFIPAISVYLVWQILYIISTEIIVRDQLDADPELMTSLRYMAKDKRNVLAVKTVQILKFMNFVEKNQKYIDPESGLAKIAMIVTQLIYTIICMLIPTLILFHSFHVSSCFLLFVCLFATWNGASYYIEIFSKRYNLKFENPEETTKTENENNRKSVQNEIVLQNSEIKVFSTDSFCCSDAEEDEVSSSYSSESNSDIQKCVEGEKMILENARRTSDSEGLQKLEGGKSIVSRNRIKYRSQTLDDTQAEELMSYFESL